MCGICGIVHFDGEPVTPGPLARMTQALIHRGPDDEGAYRSPDTAAGGARCGFGFRRLSIIDVAGGHQPMRFGRYVIVMNGEILNFRELRQELIAKGDRFRTASDTEVLVHLYALNGPRALDMLAGMFAFAIWDEETGEIFLTRDRLGIKPLYYFVDADNTRLIFASEMKSLLLSDEVPFEYDPAGVSDFFTYRFVPAPYTVLKRVRKVRPGHFIRARRGGIDEVRYWDVPAMPPSGRGLGELCAELRERLEASVRRNIVSDVAVGAFLSGGVDSSLMAALMARVSTEKVKTFSIGFGADSGIDESPVARRVAAHLGTEHHELILDGEDLVHAERALARMNEPVADPTIVPTAILSRFASDHVKVVLTGEGGDELFAGYNRYKSAVFSGWIEALPLGLRPAAAMVLRRAGKGRPFEALPEVFPANWFVLNRDFTEAALHDVGLSATAAAMSHLEGMAAHAGEKSTDPLRGILDLEIRTALADRLLMKVDMASMGESLEARPPYLDHDLVGFAASIPSRYMIRWFKGKYILRKAAESFLPRDICWRRKHGFIVPIIRWIQNGSFETLDSLLDDRWIRETGILDPVAIDRVKGRIRRGTASHGTIAALWPAIVLGCWAKGVRAADVPTRAIREQSEN
jgi:asparagine synthase (glutamine-hydrolysing)